MVYIYLPAPYYHLNLDVTKESLLAAGFSAVPAAFLVYRSFYCSIAFSLKFKHETQNIWSYLIKPDTNHLQVTHITYCNTAYIKLDTCFSWTNAPHARTVPFWGILLNPAERAPTICRRLTALHFVWNNNLHFISDTSQINLVHLFLHKSLYSLNTSLSFRWYRFFLYWECI